jgi:hypothetical protein
LLPPGGEPTDIAQAQRGFSGSVTGPIEGPCSGVQHFSSVGQELAAGWRQFDVPAVADEELGPNLSFEVTDLLRERRSSKVKALCGSPEMQFFGNGDEVGQLPEFHWVDGTGGVIGGAYQSLVISPWGSGVH